MEKERNMSQQTEAVLPEMERSLLAGAVALGRRRKVGRTRLLAQIRVARVVAAAVVCLACGGTALAATGAWDPVIGGAQIDGPVSTSESPIPEPLLEALAVLRRAPTALDHSPEVEATLREVGFADGVRPESVRFLRAGDRGEATIALSAESAVEVEAEVKNPGEDRQPVCVF